MKISPLFALAAVAVVAIPFLLDSKPEKREKPKGLLGLASANSDMQSVRQEIFQLSGIGNRRTIDVRKVCNAIDAFEHRFGWTKTAALIDDIAERTPGSRVKEVLLRHVANRERNDFEFLKAVPVPTIAN
jgi:hypothetical protein